MLYHEVAVEEDRLTLGEDRGVAVEVVPADLDHAHLLVGEIVDDVLENIARGNESASKNGDEFPRRDLHAGFEGAGFIAFAIGAVDVFDRITLGDPLLASVTRDVGRVVGAVVQDLNLKPISG